MLRGTEFVFLFLVFFRVSKYWLVVIDLIFLTILCLLMDMYWNLSCSFCNRIVTKLINVNI